MTMHLKLITAPTEFPVSTAEARAHVRAPSNADDGQLDIARAAAIAHLDGKDGILGRALCTQTWELVADAFPCGRVSIPLPPLRSVVAVQYYDTDGVLQTLPDTAYLVEPAAEPGVIEPVDAWPATKARVGAVRIRFEAGYGGAAAVPPALKSAILLLVGDLYENREAGITGATLVDNPAVDRLVFPYRVNLIG